MIKLFQFPPSNNFPNMSPFCVKLETFLKLAKIPFETKYTLNFEPNPKKMMPYVKYKEQILGDSTLIIDQLNKDYNFPIDQHLNEEQKALSTAYIMMIEETLVPMMVYYRWAHPNYWPRFRKIVFAKAPWFVEKLIAPRVHAKMKQKTFLRGTSRFSDEELLFLARKIFESIDQLLQNKKFAFGEKPCTLDCALFGVIGNIYHDEAEIPLKKLLEDFPKLKTYVDNMKLAIRLKDEAGIVDGSITKKL